MLASRPPPPLAAVELTFPPFPLFLVPPPLPPPLLHRTASR